MDKKEEKNKKYYYQKLMPLIITLLKRYGGTLTSNQIDLIIAGELDIPKKDIELVFRQTQFARTYLKKIDIINNKEKRGKWVLNKEYIEMEDREIEAEIKRRYNALYND